MLIRKFLGWEEASFEDYKACYFQYGGNFSTHPDVLSYIHQHARCDERYFVHHSSGTVDGAVCTWNRNRNRLANDTSTDDITSHLCIPVAKDELIFPVTKEKNIIVPFKSKIVSPVNKNIFNRNELINARRAICLAKPLARFSNRTIKKRNRELNKFLNEGGEIRDQTEFSVSELIDIYDFLFEKRRGVKIANKERTLDFSKLFRKNLFGKVLFINKTPCAFMQITKCESNNIISLDFINIGVDKVISKHSPGSILTWININEAYGLATEGKSIRFSFGRPTAEYKKIWCYQEKVGRLI